MSKLQEEILKSFDESFNVYGDVYLDIKAKNVREFIINALEKQKKAFLSMKSMEKLPRCLHFQKTGECGCFDCMKVVGINEKIDQIAKDLENL